MEQTNQQQEKKEHRWWLFWGVLGCFGGMFVQLVIGSLYQWGIINIYITSYYKLEDPDLNLEDNVIAFPVMMFCIGIMMRLGIFLSDLSHPLLFMSINVILQAACIFISSYVKSMGVFIVFYGVLFGLISGLNFMIPIIECNKYLPGKKMYVNGLILVGTGMGSVVFGPFSYSYLNPDKLKPIQGYYVERQLKQIALRVPQCLRYLSLLYIIIGGLGVLMLVKVCLENKKAEKKAKEQEQKKQKDAPDQTQQKIEVGQEKKVHKVQALYIDLGIDRPHDNKTVEEAVQVQEEGLEAKGPPPPTGKAKDLREAFSSKICWVQTAALFLGSCGVFLINGNYKTYVKNDISNDEFLTIIGVIGALGNGCSRFFWNLLFNKTGYKFVMLMNLCLQIVIYSIIRFTVDVPGVYLLMVFLINCCLGGLLVMAPTVAQIIFGQETGSNIYGYYWTVFACANLLQFGFMSGVQQKIGFNNVIYICLGMTVISVIIVVVYRFEGPWKNPMQQLHYCIGCRKEQQKQK